MSAPDLPPKLKEIYDGVVGLRPAAQLRVAAGVLDAGKHPYVAHAIVVMVEAELQAELSTSPSLGHRFDPSVLGGGCLDCGAKPMTDGSDANLCLVRQMSAQSSQGEGAP